MNMIIRPALIAIAACGIVAAPAAAPASAQSETDEPAQAVTKGEAKLAKMLGDRVAGEPQRCIRTLPSSSLTIIDGTAIVSKQGGTVYVNRTRNPRTLDDGDALLIRKFSGTRLCRLDTVSTFDRYSQFYTGNVFLTDFVPYRMPEADG